MTSVAAELPNVTPGVAAVGDAVIAAAGATFGLAPRRVSSDDLVSMIPDSTFVAVERTGR
jgi:hypothetical protein